MIELERQPPPALLPGYRWEAGDSVVAIGSTRLRDILDFYYLSEEEGDVTVTIARSNGRYQTHVARTQALNTLAESFAPMEFNTCAAQCVFCFIDQNPAGMRESIYVKDEDYRFSFLYGNYITLTALGPRGIQRVIEQRLTPLFVSVHATDVKVRTRMLGIKREIDVMGVLRRLLEHGIEVHTQIVLCPGWNDGEILDRTLDDLASLGDGLRSISVVPVGLSDHRDGLVELRPVEVEDARAAVAQIHARGDDFLGRHGRRLAFASDEFYLKLGIPFPDLEFYEDMPQQDTGIGMCRALIEEIQLAQAELIEARRGELTVTLLTGELAAGFFDRDLRPILDGVRWLRLHVVGVENRLYGSGITVTGLLSGADFRRALAQLSPDAGTVLLPESPINHDGLFLDDLRLEEVIAGCAHRVEVAREGLAGALLDLAAREPDA